MKRRSGDALGNKREAATRWGTSDKRGEYTMQTLRWRVTFTYLLTGMSIWVLALTILYLAG